MSLGMAVLRPAWHKALLSCRAGSIAVMKMIERCHAHLVSSRMAASNRMVLGGAAAEQENHPAALSVADAERGEVECLVWSAAA